MIKIVVVDSGVEITHKLLKKYKNLNGIGINFIDENLEITEDFKDNYGHGTAINHIIKSHCSDCEIFNIKLFNSDNQVDEYQLIKTLEYIYYNIECDILNLSLGLCVCENYDRLYDICSKLKEKGVIIVSAFDNNGAISYPAAFDNVIGVTTSEECKNKFEYSFIENSIVNIGAYGKIQRLAWIKPEFLMIGGNSFACPHITGIIAGILKDEKLNFDDILYKLKLNSNYKKENKINNKKQLEFFDIKNAVLFPFNKEMHSLVRYNNILEFNITGIYDTKYSFNIGRKVVDILNIENSINLDIENLSNLKWENFDTIILGHTDELSNLINQEQLKQDIIIDCLKNEKNIFSFDDLSDYEEIILKYNKNSKIYFPKITEENLPLSSLGKLYKYSKPIVGVFGTSSRQGKFTLQIALRKQFLDLGYSVGQLGTEPSALLYGLDDVYPMGYNSSVNLNQYQQVLYLNNVINSLCLKNNELILVGCQSNTIAYDMSNLNLMPLNQNNFLLAIQPDVVVLCVNPFDDIDYIKRTVDYIENCVDCKVVSINVFPMTLKDDWTGIYSSKRKITDLEFEKFKKKLQSILNIPIYNLNNENTIYNISQDIIEYFS